MQRRRKRVSKITCFEFTCDMISGFLKHFWEEGYCHQGKIEWRNVVLDSNRFEIVHGHGQPKTKTATGIQYQEQKP